MKSNCAPLEPTGIETATINRRPSTNGAGQAKQDNRANQGNQGGGTTAPAQGQDPWAAPATTDTSDGWGTGPADSSEPPF